MKQFIICFFLLLLKFNIFSQTIIGKSPIITFVKEIHDFGNVEYGGNTIYAFEFTNIGNDTLFILNATSSCGCTIPEWTKGPIAPNTNGFILVKYNSFIVGPINKSVIVFSNSIVDKEKVLRIKGEVLYDLTEKP